MLNNLASIYHKDGNFKKTLKLQIKSLKIKKQIAGSKDDSYSKGLANIGLTYKEMNELQNSNNYLMESLILIKEIGI